MAKKKEKLIVVDIQNDFIKRDEKFFNWPDHCIKHTDPTIEKVIIFLTTCSTCGYGENAGKFTIYHFLFNIIWTLTLIYLYIHFFGIQ